MAEKSKDSEISLSPNKTNSSAVYTLKVPNFFTLPEYDDTSFYFESPPFDFANATWRFQLESRKKEVTETGGCKKSFAIYLVRLNFEIPQQNMFYALFLLNADDRRYKSLSDADVFSEKYSTHLMWILNNDEPSYDTRDVLTLIIHLFCESTELDEIQETLTADRGAETLSNDFKKLLLNGKHHDLTLKVADKEFSVHQDILMVRSPVFEAMLSHDMREKNKGFIDVPDCNPEVMEEFLIYVYSGKVEQWNQDNAVGLYYLADKYNMLLLKEECTKFIKKSLTHIVICDVIQLALKHSDSDMLECATEYFGKHLNDILPTPGWMSFMTSNAAAANELLIKATKKIDLRERYPFMYCVMVASVKYIINTV